MISSKIVIYGALLVASEPGRDADIENQEEDGGCMGSTKSQIPNRSPSCHLLEGVKFERDDEEWVQDLGGTATIFSEVMNMAKNLVLIKLVK